jgi:hypothetical protein
MGQFELIEMHLCPRCLAPGDESGPCPVCGTERIHCRPGDLDDPCRRPLMDKDGRVRTRAPLWWLRHTVTRLTELQQED